MTRRKPDHEVPEPERRGMRADKGLPPHDLAPIEIDPDADAPAHVERAAIVFPTADDEATAYGQILESDPDLAHANQHVVAKALREQLAKNARALGRRKALADVVAEPGAPAFPTEAHALDLRDAIPTISDEEIKAVIAAGYGAYVASLDAGEPITVPS